ncbi:MAG: right-handed parallel beta-helix repeat-containing protein [Bacteroidales bacterium]|nr:right-handed parallel beta-helix repeat-containing protein [Bacteroidales bacterium]
MKRNHLNIVPVILLILLVCSCNNPGQQTRNYYLDSSRGNDEANGISSNTPWKSLNKLNSVSLKPGDSVLFASGSFWSQTLIISESGLEDAPITYSSYGQGDKPHFSNPDEEMGSCIVISADWITVENTLTSNAQHAGIYLMDGADNNTLKQNEVTAVGLGISIDGNYNTITQNFVHDLQMVVNNPGGDNDYGAVGIWLGSPNGTGSPSGNDISFNKLVRCSALSMDYGKDGGAVEFYGNAHNNTVHHNYAKECNGFFEIGGQKDTLTNNTIAFNLMINNGYAGSFHGGGKFGVTIKNMRIEHNVIYELRTQGILIGFWAGDFPPSAVRYCNNIFYLPHYSKVSNSTSFTHEYNIYYMGEKTTTGLPLGEGEMVCNPNFVDGNNYNFHLRSNSLAIDTGKDLKYTQDYNLNPIPMNKKTDIGAFEYQN